MKKQIPTYARLNRLPTLLVLLLLAGQVCAQINGRIVTTDNRTISGKIRWLATQKKYIIQTTRPNSQTTIEIELQPDQVADIAVPQPSQLAPAIQAVRSGRNTAQAIAILEKIVSTYARLQWDEPAARGLAEAQLANNNPNEAIKACEVVINTKPEAAYMGDLAVIYWQALLKANRSAKLNTLLREAIAKGGRQASASALIMRGDMLMERKQPRDALKDGYLRVIVLYEREREVQPEALYKAAKAFEALQQNPNAEKMRTMLRTKFPGSEYAKMI